jgi:hypothetical protein
VFPPATVVLFLQNLSSSSRVGHSEFTPGEFKGKMTGRTKIGKNRISDTAVHHDDFRSGSEMASERHSHPKSRSRGTSAEKSDDEDDSKKIALPERKGNRTPTEFDRIYYRYGVPDETPKTRVQRRIREVISDYALDLSTNRKAIFVLALLSGRARDKYWHVLQELVDKNEKCQEPYRKSHNELSSMAFLIYIRRHLVHLTTANDKSIMSKPSPVSTKRRCWTCGDFHYASDCYGWGNSPPRPRKQWCPLCGSMHYTPEECVSRLPGNPQT